MKFIPDRRNASEVEAVAPFPEIRRFQDSVKNVNNIIITTNIININTKFNISFKKCQEQGVKTHLY
jgi:hypothetical protein